MAQYTTLRRGNSNTEENRKLQQALKDNGYGSYLGSASVDGIYGSGTDAGVRAFQKDKGLQVDGVVGKDTWEALLRGSNTNTQPTQQAAPAVPDYSAYQHDPSGNAAYNYANSMLEEAYKGVSTPTYGHDAVQEAADRIINRDKFKYDLNGDVLYQQYKDQYTNMGKLAMMDTMGQAAALTGGYGSSYAQSAGQQAYQGYLQQLNEVIPELYGMAYEQYQQEGQDLLNQYAMTKEMEDTKYNTAMDAQDAAWKAVNYWQGVANSEYDKDFNNWYTAQQLGTAADDRAYQKQQDNKNYLLSLISAGYNPSDEELQAAGMTRSEADALKNEYNRQVAASYSGNDENEGGEYTPVINYKDMGYESYNEMTEAFAEIANTQGDDALYKKLMEYVDAGYLDETSFTNLCLAYIDEDSATKKTSIMTRDAWIRRTGSALGYTEYLKQNGVNLV